MEGDKEMIFNTVGKKLFETGWSFFTYQLVLYGFFDASTLERNFWVSCLNNDSLFGCQMLSETLQHYQVSTNFDETAWNPDQLQVTPGTFQPKAWSMDNSPKQEKVGVQFICANVKMPRVL